MKGALSRVEERLQAAVQHLSPSTTVAVSFLGVILVGAMLLALPVASVDGRSIGLLDALFTSTSATCVTGLVVRDTGQEFSLFGQTIILILIQAGGLGIMTLSAIFAMLLGMEMGLRSSTTVKDSLDMPQLGNLFRMLRYIAATTLTVEAIGAVPLALALIPQFGWRHGLYSAVFHSVSAFCNAGFCLYPDSLMSQVSHPGVIWTVALLLVLGGLGFAVLRNLFEVTTDRFRRSPQPRRISFQTRVVLSVSGALILLTVPAIFFLESGSTIPEDAPLLLRFTHAFFHAVTPRTAGFNTLAVQRFHPATLLLTMILMFIGASPGSTGGGIKTTTVAVILAMVRTFARNRPHPELFRKTVPRNVIYKAVSIMIISGILVLIGSLSMLGSERHLWTEGSNQAFAPILFEVISAFGTVGLSTGITPDLSGVGKLTIILLMYVGRIGPLTLALAMAQGPRIPVAYKFPETSLMVG